MTKSKGGRAICISISPTPSSGGTCPPPRPPRDLRPWAFHWTLWLTVASHC